MSYFTIDLCYEIGRDLVSNLKTYDMIISLN